MFAQRDDRDGARQAPDVDVRPGRFVAAPGASARADAGLEQTGEGFSATYADADVRLVVNQILGDFLGLDYSIAPDVSGAVTMRISEVRSRAQALDALRAALAPLGILVVERGDFIAIVQGSAGGVTGAVAVIAPGEPAPAGAGAAVLTPRYVVPSVLAALIEPFAVPGTVGLADDERKLLVLRGEEAAITAASEAAGLFDVSWFAQVSTGVFPLVHVAPEELAGELRPLLGPSEGEVELIPLPRLSSLVVLSRSPDVLRAVRAWIERLDVAPVRTATRGLLIYDARYADAETLAASISSLMGGVGYAPAPSSDDDRAGDFMPQSTLGQGFAAPGAVGAAPVGPRPQASSGQSSLRSSSLAAAAPMASAAEGSVGTGRNVIITAVRDQNAVIARGEESDIAEVRALLEALDRPRAQVLIEATIVEVTLNDELRYGVNWAGVEDGRLSAVFTDAPDGAVVSRFPGFSVSYVNVDVAAAINLLSSITTIEVVSRPSVIALNNERASLQIGDQVPIVTQTAVSVLDPNAPIVNQTTYRDTGVILSVIPHVRAGGTVEIDIAQEVSDVARTTSSGIDSPTITQRRIESRLVVPSGGSVALGGLISSSRTVGETGVPILKSVPLFGRLFRSNAEVLDRTELIVFLTPRVLATPREAVDASVEMRAAFSRLEALLADR
jgi:general secretion pathway protein D